MNHKVYDLKLYYWCRIKGEKKEARWEKKERRENSEKRKGIEREGNLEREQNNWRENNLYFFINKCE